MIGKHTEEAQKIKQLEETVAAKDKEIKDIKFSLADILLRIRNLNESNDYGDSSVKRRKISEYRWILPKGKSTNNKTTYNRPKP